MLKENIEHLIGKYSYEKVLQITIEDPKIETLSASGILIKYNILFHSSSLFSA